MPDFAPASAAAGRGELLSNFGLPLLRRLTELSSAWRGRKLVNSMHDFDDAQLADIGIKRADVEAALQLPIFVNPSLYLEAVRKTRI
jgi:uncharacterized protein YjiS (DUF1127 family)